MLNPVIDAFTLTWLIWKVKSESGAPILRLPYLYPLRLACGARRKALMDSG